MRDTQPSTIPWFMDAKDVVITQSPKEIAHLREEVRLLKEIVARFKKDSTNSSKLPSSDIVNPQKSTRKVSWKKRKRDAQQGRKKHTRQSFESE